MHRNNKIKVDEERNTNERVETNNNKMLIENVARVEKHLRTLTLAVCVCVRHAAFENSIFNFVIFFYFCSVGRSNFQLQKNKQKLKLN